MILTLKRVIVMVKVRLDEIKIRLFNKLKHELSNVFGLRSLNSFNPG